MTFPKISRLFEKIKLKQKNNQIDKILLRKHMTYMTYMTYMTTMTYMTSTTSFNLAISTSSTSHQ